MKEVKLKFLLWLFLSMVIVHSGYAQDITVQGQVWDDTLGEPMIGVNVSVKGTTNGVITDFDGNFTIKAKNNDVIVFSFIGYKDVTVVVKPALSPRYSNIINCYHIFINSRIFRILRY